MATVIKKKILEMSAVFFVGWLLSPFTFWNDLFVNIPLSYILANILRHLVNLDFMAMVLISYWATNILGVFLMIISGREIFKKNEMFAAELLKLIAAIIVYSGILVLLIRIGIVRPIF